MKRVVLPIMISAAILIAAFLGLFAQDIAYYFEDHLFYEPALKMLTIVTITSVSLFILAFIAGTILLSIERIKPKVYIRLLIANVFIGFFVSLWSLFILAMWWG